MSSRKKITGINMRTVDTLSVGYPIVKRAVSDYGLA
jgi:hypothetical protein